MANPGGRQTLRDLLWFLVVGTLGAGLYVGLAALLHRLGLATAPASAIGYGLCIPAVYLAQRSLAFRSDAAHRTAFPRYAAVQMLGLSLAALLPPLFERGLGLTPAAAFAGVAVTTPACSFVALRFWAFRRG